MDDLNGKWKYNVELELVLDENSCPHQANCAPEACISEKAKNGDSEQGTLVIEFSDDEEDISLLKDYEDELPKNLKSTVRRIALAEIVSFWVEKSIKRKLSIH